MYDDAFTISVKNDQGPLFVYSNSLNGFPESAYTQTAMVSVSAGDYSPYKGNHLSGVLPV